MQPGSQPWPLPVTNLIYPVQSDHTQLHAAWVVSQGWYCLAMRCISETNKKKELQEHTLLDTPWLQCMFSFLLLCCVEACHIALLGPTHFRGIYQPLSCPPPPGSSPSTGLISCCYFSPFFCSLRCANYSPPYFKALPITNRQLTFDESDEC